MVRLAVDFENPSRQWWDGGGRELWEGITEDFDGHSVVLEESLADSWLAAARKIPGWVRKERTLEALADAIDLPREALAATVERYNAQARAGRDLDFHRGESIWERAKTGTTA